MSFMASTVLGTSQLSRAVLNVSPGMTPISEAEWHVRWKLRAQSDERTAKAWAIIEGHDGKN